MTITDQVVRGPVRKERPAPSVRTATRRNARGHDLGPVELEPTIFGLEPNVAVMHQVVTAQLAAARSGTQSTRTRAEVRGGGAKPFSQKGTGRARQGSSRSPSMSGGGVALGPKPRSYRQHTPKKMVRLALLSALSDRALNDRVGVLDHWSITEPKTRDAALVLRKLRLTGTVLVVLAGDETIVERSLRNLPHAHATTYAELSAHDVLRHDWILFTDRTLPTSVDLFSGAALPEAVPLPEVEPEAPAKAPTKAKAVKKAKPAAKAAAVKADEPAEVAAEAAPEPEATVAPADEEVADEVQEADDDA